MFLSVHTITAISTIKYIHNPLLLFLVNFILHHILDIIPHESRNKITKGFKNKNINLFLMLIMDFLFVIILFFTSHQYLEFSYQKLIFAISGAILPDFLWGFFLLTKWKYLKWTYDLNLKIHQIIKRQKFYLVEYSVQIIPILISYFILKKP